ncbi:MAG: hypothetical protein KF901_18055, partial [Myxococcales bacterium]|nr:hypothetical protein [Myxococcales bacterium]
LEGGPPELMLTQTGVVLGTPLYMAPEQLKGRPLDGRCDQYALACILYELVEGRPPFEADNYAELAAAKLRGKPAPLRALVPPPFRAALERALATSPDDRFPSVIAFAAALEPVAEGVRFRDDADTSGLFPSSNSAPELDPTLLDGAADTLGSTHIELTLAGRRWRAALVALAVVVVVTGLAVGWSLRGPTEPQVARESQSDSGEMLPTERDQALDEPIASRDLATGAAPGQAAQPDPSEPSIAEPTSDDVEVGTTSDEAAAPRARRPRVRHRTGGVSLGDF